MNLISKTILFSVGSAMSLAITPSCANAPQSKQGKHSGEVRVASQKDRYLKIKDYLQSPNIAVAHVDGLVCPSCAIGIRTHASKLAFIDSSTSQQGIKLDVSHQLVVLNLKPGQKVSPSAFAAAVRDAGYKPVEFYQMKKKNGVDHVSAMSLLK